MDKSISIVIPCVQSDIKILLSNIYRLEEASIYFHQIIIVLSNLSLFNEKIISACPNLVVLTHDKVLMPGEARNVGVDYANSKYILFLDVRTIPQVEWLMHVSSSVRNCTFDLSLGNVKYSASSFMGNALIMASYGYNPLVCLPGSIIRKDLFNTIGLFLPYIRAGEDVEWLNRIKFFKLLSAKLERESLEYRINPDLRLDQIFTKWYRNYKSSAQVPYIYDLQKIAYFLFGAVFIVLLASMWNWQVARWNTSSMFYVPYITKLVTILLASAYVLYRAVLLPIQKGARFKIRVIPLFVASFIIAFGIDIVKLLAFGVNAFSYTTVNNYIAPQKI